MAVLNAQEQINHQMCHRTVHIVQKILRWKSSQSLAILAGGLLL